MTFKFSRITPVAAFFMAFFLPFHTGLSNAFLILMFVSVFLSYIFQKTIEKRPLWLLVFSMLPLFLLTLLGQFYSEPLFYGAKILGKTISFLLCALLFLYLPGAMLFRIRRHLTNGLVLGCVLAVSYLLLNNFLNYYATRPFPSWDEEFLGFYHTYHKFTEPFIDFAAYMGAYVVFAIAILYHRIYQRRRVSFWEGLAILILSIGLIFINSRIILFLFAVITVLALLVMLWFFVRNKSVWGVTFLLVSTLFVSGGVYYLLSDSFVSTRLNEELQWELSDQRGTGYNPELVADSRIPRWKAAVTVSAKKPLFGYGTYMEKNILAEQYEKDGLWTSLRNRYDAHNMYLSIALEHGIVGLFIFLLFLVGNAFTAIRRRDALYFFFVFMVAAVCVFESYLGNNAGITYVALFMTVFYYSQNPGNDRN